jgi:DNA-binding transcriptional MerR regulator
MTQTDLPGAVGGPEATQGHDSLTADATERPMRIGELAERIGVNPKTIRYYEAIGLLPKPRRRPSGYRSYDTGDLERVAFIRRAQQFGLRLDVIGEILGLRDRGARPCDYVLAAVGRELDDLDRRMAELAATRAQLAALVARAESLPPTDGRYCGLLEHRDIEDET